MKKKLLALVLAASMVVGGSMTAFAEDVTGEAEVNVPTITVDVPTTLAFVINPFSLEVTEGTGDDAKVLGKTQIVCEGVEIKNSSDVNVEVNVSKVKAEKKDGASENLTIATAPLTKENTGKDIFLFLEVGSKLSGTYKDTNANQIAITGTESTTSKRLGVVPAASKAKDGTKTPGKILAGVGGSVVPTPVTGTGDAAKSEPWTGDDVVSVAFTLDFAATMDTK